MKNNNHSKFMDGLTKLENNILKSVMRTAETGLIEPFIEIPEELDPTFSISFDSNFETIRNDTSIFDFITSEISFQTDFGEGSASMLKEIYKNELKNSDYISGDCILLTKNTYNLMDLTLISEFAKEISDAYFIITNSIASEITKAVFESVENNNDSDKFMIDVHRFKSSLFNSIVDPNWDDNIRQFIIESRFYKKMPDAYTAYNYEFLLRNRLMNDISYNIYAAVRNYLYKVNITPSDNGELYYQCYNKIVHMYLYVFDTMLSILCKAFQYKVALCYQDIDILINGLETDEEISSTPLLIEKF